MPVEWYSLFERPLEKARVITDEIFILGDINMDSIKPESLNPS